MGSRSSIFFLRAALVSGGVAAAGMAMHFASPAIAAFLFSEGPRLYATLRALMTPPYLYFVINGIIIFIAASSHFQKAADRDDTDPAAGSAAPPEISVVVVSEFTERHIEEESPPVDLTDPPTMKQEEELVISRSSLSPKRKESSEIPPTEYSLVPEKPLVSVRFSRRRSLKASPEGKGLGVARPKRNETLENTWKAITDRRAVPLARHLKKSDTWGDSDDRGTDKETPVAEVVMRKSETFIDRGNRPPSIPSPVAALGKLKRDPSLGQEDLNRRVEAFINKINGEMRLQRLQHEESFQHYMDMINRGS